MYRLSARIACRTLIVALMSGSTTLVLAQTDSNQTLLDQADSASAALRELDEKASLCLDSFNMNLGEAAALLCDEFMRAVDGQLLAAYIDDCKSLKAWRDEFIEKSVSQTNNNQQEIDSSAELELMVAVEYICSDDALKERTVSVVPAFNALNNGSLLNQTISQSLDQKVAELEFQSRLDSQGRALQNAIQRQGQQSNNAVQQQMRQLENELIRQQINNPR